jgi:hypothetical protein
MNNVGSSFLVFGIALAVTLTILLIHHLSRAKPIDHARP